MPSTYSPDLRIELIANGEQSGTWGTTTNNNLGTLIEDAISGAASVVTATQKYALLAANGTVDEARCAILVLDTTYVGAGNYEVYAPPVTKLYVVKNASTTKDLDLYCATTINGTTAAGVAYTIPQGKTAFVRSNGVEFFDATDYVAGSVTFTNAELITPSLSGETFSTANTVAAGSNSQGSGALTADYNVITTTGSNPSGVTLPTATAGRRIIIVNKGTNPINVYPATGAGIDALGLNTAINLPVDGLLEFNASSTTRWYSSFNATTAASVGGVSFTGTQPTASVNQVAVYGATGSSITTARTYQFRATSAGAAQIQLFEDTDNGTNSVIIQPPATLAADYTLTLPADDGTSGQVLSTNGTGTLSWITPSGGGTGDVTGPASSTNNALARFDSTTGKLIQNSTGILSDTGALSGVTLAATTITSGTLADARLSSNVALLTGTQTFTGAKTFSSIVAASYNFSGTSSIYLNAGVEVKIDVLGAPCFQFTPAGNYSQENLMPTNDNTVSLGAGAKRWTVVYAVTGTINTSDAREKTEVQATDFGLSFIKQLRPVKYKWIDGGNGVPGVRWHYGLIAQEVKEVIGDGNNFAGWVKGDVSDPESVEGLRYDQFIAPLIKSVQELSAEIDALKAKIAALEKA
jgi:hypothetical protein